MDRVSAMTVPSSSTSRMPEYINRLRDQRLVLEFCQVQQWRTECEVFLLLSWISKLGILSNLPALILLQIWNYVLGGKEAN